MTCTTVIADCNHGLPTVVISNAGPPGPAGADGAAGSVTSNTHPSVNGRIVVFDGTSGNAIKDGGKAIADLALASDLAGKVDKILGKGLSTNDFDNTYKGLLDALINGTFVGAYDTDTALLADWPTAPDGSYAVVRDVGTVLSPWFWDDLNSVWVEVPVAPTTAAGIEAILATDTDWNKFTDTYKAKVDASVDTTTFNSAIAAFSAGTAFAAVVNEATTNRILAVADAGKYLRSTNAGGCNYDLPDDATALWVGFPEIRFRIASAGAVTVTPAGGVTVNGIAALAGLTTDANFALKKVAVDEWDLVI